MILPLFAAADAAATLLLLPLLLPPLMVDYFSLPLRLLPLPA